MSNGGESLQIGSTPSTTTSEEEAIRQRGDDGDGQPPVAEEEDIKVQYCKNINKLDY